jgi:hypothetical protein
MTALHHCAAAPPPFHPLPRCPPPRTPEAPSPSTCHSRPPSDITQHRSDITHHRSHIKHHRVASHVKNANACPSSWLLMAPRLSTPTNASMQHTHHLRYVLVIWSCLHHCQTLGGCVGSSGVQVCCCADSSCLQGVVECTGLHGWGVLSMRKAGKVGPCMSPALYRGVACCDPPHVTAGVMRSVDQAAASPDHKPAQLTAMGCC